MSTTAGAAYSRGEEIAHVWTHGVGAALSVAGTVVLVSLAAVRGDAWCVTATAIFGGSLVLMYSASSLYHGFRSEPAKRLLRKFDHAAIFLLIAGTYTPFLLVNLRGPWGWSLLAVVWTLAIAGVMMKFWFAGRFRVASTVLYLVLGWLVLIALRPMLRSVAPSALWLLLAGGLSYSVGTVFYLWKRLPYHHAVWHLFVLGGSICHFFAVLAAVIPPPAVVSG